MKSPKANEADVAAAISKQKPNLSSGPDNLPSLLFKKLKNSLSYPLSLIFAQLLSIGFYLMIGPRQLSYQSNAQKGTSGDVAR